MPSYNLKYRKKKIGKGFQFKPLSKHPQQEMVEKVEEERKEQDENESLLEELLEDIVNIKSVRSLEYFIADNKDYINQLDPTNKSNLLQQIEKQFYR